MGGKFARWIVTSGNRGRWIAFSSICCSNDSIYTHNSQRLCVEGRVALQVGDRAVLVDYCRLCWRRFGRGNGIGWRRGYLRSHLMKRSDLVIRCHRIECQWICWGRWRRLPELLLPSFTEYEIGIIDDTGIQDRYAECRNTEINQLLWEEML